MRIETMFRRRRKGVRLAPLIDVVFILLLFFMLTTGFVPWRQIPVSFPTPAADADVAELRVVQVVEGGILVVDGARYRTDDATALRALVREQPDAVYAVRAYPAMRTQTLVTVVDRLRQAGATQVSLVKTQP